jgi:hypothetical protein
MSPWRTAPLKKREDTLFGIIGWQNVIEGKFLGLLERGYQPVDKSPLFLEASRTAQAGRRKGN